MTFRSSALAAAFLFGAASPAASQMIEPIVADFNRFEAAFLTEHGMTAEEAIDEHAAGGSIVVISGFHAEQRVYGARNAHKGAPTNFNTIYRMGSIAKLFTGPALARAHGKGEFDLDESLADFADTRPNGDADTWRAAAFSGATADYPDTITMRRLIRSMAGLDTHGVGNRAPTDPCNDVAKLVIGLSTSFPAEIEL